MTNFLDGLIEAGLDMHHFVGILSVSDADDDYDRGEDYCKTEDLLKLKREELEKKQDELLLMFKREWYWCEPSEMLLKSSKEEAQYVRDKFDGFLKQHNLQTGEDYWRNWA